MKMGDIATKLGEVRLDDMKGFRGLMVQKETLWKLLFSYVVNFEGDKAAPEWVADLFVQLVAPPLDETETIEHNQFGGPSKTVISGTAGKPIIFDCEIYPYDPWPHLPIEDAIFDTADKTA